MDLMLTCVLCLAGAAPYADPAAGAAPALSMAAAPAPGLDLRLSDPAPPADRAALPALAQHQHGSEDEGEDGSERHHGGGAWMGTTMIVVMVAMMTTVGIVMMSRGGWRSAPASGPAAVAIPVVAPAGLGTPGG